MTVQIQTVAAIAPAGIAFTVWAATNSQQTSGIPITWSDDTGLPNLWQSTTTYTGDTYPLLASGVITVPLSYVGATGKNVKITAASGALGTQDITIKFEDWGANPQFGTVITSDLVMFPKDDVVNNSITYEVKMLKSDGVTPVGAGAEVQWFTQPQNFVAKLYDASTDAAAVSVRGGSWYAVKTDANGYGKVKVTTQRSMAVEMQAQSPTQTVFSNASTAYFVDEDDTRVVTKFGAPRVDDVQDGFLNVTSRLNYGEVLPSLANSQYANSSYGAFLYVGGAGANIPWATDDASIFDDQVVLGDLPLAGLKIDQNDIHANTTLFFLQSTSGNIYKSLTAAFGAKGVYKNAPDPSITDRPFYAPAPLPDPGLGGYIINDSLRVYDGLYLKYGRSLGAGYAVGSGKVVFNFYMNGVDKSGNNYNRLWTVDAVEPVNPATTSYHAVLAYAKANGYYPNPVTQQYGLFWAEMAFVPTGEDTNRQNWTYSQYNSYILATGA